MFSHSHQIRVRYGETDQMSYVYYGNYPLYLEVARVEMLRSLGMTYKRFEEEGVMMPVRDLSCRYIRPAYYDELLTIKTYLKELPSSRIHFFYEIFNEKEELIHQAETTLVFVSMESKRVCEPPSYFIEALKPYFNA
jgi:acyl-CoA thioester hydrolase